MNYKSLIVFGIIALMAISSCKKDSAGNVIIPKMTATIDGKGWTSVTRLTGLTSNIFTITGTSITGESLIVVISGSTVGTYNFPLSGCTYNVSSNSYVSISGTASLTKVDKVAKIISGTFQFTATKIDASKTISSGVFTDLSYTTTN